MPLQYLVLSVPDLNLKKAIRTHTIYQAFRIFNSVYVIVYFKNYLSVLECRTYKWPSVCCVCGSFVSSFSRYI